MFSSSLFCYKIIIKKFSSMAQHILRAFRNIKIRKILISSTVVLIVVFLYNQCELQRKYFNDKNMNHEKIVVDLSENYFRSQRELDLFEPMVNTSKCRIPDLPIWTPEINEFITKPPDLKCNVPKFTYVQEQTVVINHTALGLMGYQLTDVSCCYQTIHRVNQQMDEFDTNADNQYRYSSECYPMKTVTTPNHGFIFVICSKRNFFWKQTIYQNFHLISMFPEETAESSLSKKLLYWQKCATTNPPPNILLIGIDSTSRLNFRRFLLQTTQVLEKQLGAVDMKGYTKVGENTFPNFVPLMSSYSQEELVKICYKNRWEPQDSCPYIWKDFSRLNYLTAHLEDCPLLAIFNFLKTGFVQAPTDIYLRPWMWAAYHSQNNEPWTVDCIGYQSPSQHILNYIVDLATLSQYRNIPYFITTWLTDITHENLNNAQMLDQMLSETLTQLQERHLLDNTVLLVMGDHGYRFGDIRSTISGWYEDKLPALFIKLPDTLIENKPTWLEALQYNSRQLTAPFNVHATLKDIVNLASSKLETQTLSECHMHNWTVTGTGSNFSSDETILRGLSLFTKLSSRSCNEAGVPLEYCACYPPVAYSQNLPIVQQAAKETVNFINKNLPGACAPLKVDRITASAILLQNNSAEQINTSKLAIRDHIIAIVTQPGKFKFEAVVTFTEVTGTFSVSSVLRTSKKNRNTGCLTENEVANFELYCYCKH